MTRALVTAFVVLAAAVLVSCFGDPVSGRTVVGRASIDLRSLMSQTSGSGADVNGVRVVVTQILPTTRREVSSKVFGRDVIDASDQQETLTLSITFPYSSADDRFEVSVQAFNTRGDTLYRAGPVAFTVRDATGSSSTVTVTTPAVYVGPGAAAVRLTIAPRTLNLTEGQSQTAIATLYDGAGNALSTEGVTWWTLDPSIGFVSNNAVGTVTGGNHAGTSRLVARWDPKKLADTITITNSVRATQLVVTQGNNQSTRVGTPFATPVTVQARSSSGQGVAGVAVTFAVTQGGGTVSSATVTTSAPDGLATVTWVAGTTVGTQQLTASMTGGVSVTINGTATAGAASAAKSSVSVLPTAIQANGELATVTATVRDAGNNPLANTQVSFSGTGSAVFTSNSTTTNASGVATTQVRATAPGTITITAMVGSDLVGSTTLAVGLASSTPVSISIVSGDNQTVQIGHDFPKPLVVVVYSAAGSPVAGASVDWGTAAGNARQVTDANGQSSAIYTLPANWPTGTGTITVTLTGTTATATFHYTAVP